MPFETILPSALQFDQIIEQLTKIANTRVEADYSGAPGPTFLAAGDKEAGLFGFVPQTDFVTGADVASAIGLTAGTNFNNDAPWIKLMLNNKVLFVPMRSQRYNLSWESIYNVGAVYGVGDEGFLPPKGRAGETLSIDASDNSINSSIGGFLGDSTSGDDYADTVGAIGETLRLKGWSNGANNGDFTIDSITDSKIVLSGGTLVTESGTKTGRFYKTDNMVTQDATISHNGLVYRVRLMKGGAAEPLDSYADADRGLIGGHNEYEKVILPLHEFAKTGDWRYPQYVGTVEDWGVGLTNEDLLLWSIYGSGSYRWMQETSDTTPWRRLYRGFNGASFGFHAHSFSVNSAIGWAPVLELLNPQTS